MLDPPEALLVVGLRAVRRAVCISGVGSRSTGFDPEVNVLNACETKQPTRTLCNAIKSKKLQPTTNPDELHNYTRAEFVVLPTFAAARWR